MFIEFVQQFIGVCPEKYLYIEYVFGGFAFLIMLLSFVGLFWCSLIFLGNLFRRR